MKKIVVRISYYTILRTNNIIYAHIYTYIYIYIHTYVYIYIGREIFTCSFIGDLIVQSLRAFRQAAFRAEAQGYGTHGT